MPALTFAGPPGAVDELNVWAAAPAAEPRDFAFESAAPPALDAVRWEQELTHAPGPAKDFAAGDPDAAEARLAAAARALPHAAGRATLFAAADGLAPGVAPALAGPERELAAWVALSRPAAPFESALAAEAVPRGESLAQRADFRQAAEQVAAFFAKVRDALRNYAAIITRRNGVPVAVTEVAWSGGFRSAWAPGLPLEDARRHLAAVTLALRTRDLWLRLAATVLSSAAQLAALFAANPLLALPAAYRFIREIIAQAQALAAPA